jgi:hypothetical protein
MLKSRCTFGCVHEKNDFMSQALAEWVDVAPDVYQLITEDDEPVDNLPSEKHQRPLTETLYSSWVGPGEGGNLFGGSNYRRFLSGA